MFRLLFTPIHSPLAPEHTHSLACTLPLGELDRHLLCERKGPVRRMVGRSVIKSRDVFKADNLREYIRGLLSRRNDVDLGDNRGGQDELCDFIDRRRDAIRRAVYQMAQTIRKALNEP